MTFCNNLRKGDQVLFKGVRKATVANNPRESSLWVALLFEGCKALRYEHIRHLRLVVDGVPEEVPPCDGDLPDESAKSPTVAETQRDPDCEIKGNYLITYRTSKNTAAVASIDAKGIVNAVTVFYLAYSETRIISIVCLTPV